MLVARAAETLTLIRQPDKLFGEIVAVLITNPITCDRHHKVRQRLTVPMNIPSASSSEVSRSEVISVSVPVLQRRT
eukprot:scaffold13957_cov19-Prasinocladus_malaysianus.AAC.1